MKTATKKPRWKRLARHVNNLVRGATITESVLAPSTIDQPSMRRFTATINGFEGFKIYEGPARENLLDDVRRRVQFIKDRIDRGDEGAFYEKDAADRSEWIGRIYLDAKLTFPRRNLLGPGSKRFKHLIGIDRQVHGFFLANNEQMIVDRETFREIAAEAKEAGAKPHWFIYGRICTYSGPNMEFMQVGSGE